MKTQNLNHKKPKFLIDLPQRKTQKLKKKKNPEILPEKAQKNPRNSWSIGNKENPEFFVTQNQFNWSRPKKREDEEEERKQQNQFYPI